MMKSLLISSVVALAFASCTAPNASQTEPAEPMASADATADAASEELDPNDPNVLVCPVTGAMQRLEPGDDGYHATGDRDDGSY